MSARAPSYLLCALLAILAVSGCATSKPYVSVVGTSHATSAPNSLVVVVEIHNPTTTPLRLSQLDYTLARRGDDSRTRGSVTLRDTVAPGHTSTVDIEVPLSAGANRNSAYDLSGRLRGFAGDVELNWRIAALAQEPGVR
jgi:hypothetical protein